MDIAKENPVTLSNRAGIKGNIIAFSTSKRLTALSDVRNTVHDRNVAEPRSVKQFLEIETGRSLETVSPRRKQSLSVKRFEEDASTLSENLDEYVFTACRCNSNDEVYEDDFLPEELELSDADIDNLKKIWFGQGGREEEKKYIFSPLRVDRSDLDLEALRVKPDFEENNDSGIELDIELELDEMCRDFQFLF